jgi:chromosome segregation ATPase
MELNMALTRKLLEGLGVEGKTIESIIEAHSETVNALKAERDTFRKDAERAADLQRQLEEAKADTSLADLRKAYDKLTKEDEKLKADLETATSALSETREELDVTKGELETAKAEGETLKTANDELTSKLTTAETERDGLRTEYDDYKAGVEADKTQRAKASAYRKQVLEKAGIAAKYLDDVMGVTKLDSIELDEDGNIANLDEQVEGAKEKWGSFILKTRTDPAPVETPPAENKDGATTIDGAHERAVQIARERHERLYGKSKE